MTLKEIVDIQKDFDSKHKSLFSWNEKIENNNLETLEFLLIAFAGEFGELSNIVKKIIRGDFSLEEKLTDISEELTDMFIYLIKLSYQLNIDIEKAYLLKLNKNQERFKKYEEKNT